MNASMVRYRIGGSFRLLNLRGLEQRAQTKDIEPAAPFAPAPRGSL